jgi:catechol 2,3-dioxygenase-like lactoylglutathione lyase family enzyme
MATIDHLILAVNDLDASARFYAEVLGFAFERRDGPFAVVRVSPDFILQLAPSGTEGGAHLAFEMAPAEFDAAFARIKERGIGYGSAFNNVGSNTGPGWELGAHGMGASIYFLDPNKHLFEIRTPRESGDVGGVLPDP